MVIRQLVCLDILSDHNQKCSDKCQFWSQNVQCPTVTSSTEPLLLDNTFYIDIIVVSLPLTNAMLSFSFA